MEVRRNSAVLLEPAMPSIRRAKAPHSSLILSLDGEGTLVDQVLRALRAEIRNLSVGSRMPPTRALSEDLGVSRNTVIAAYAELANEGLIVSHFGGGSFVSDLERAERPLDVRALSGTEPARPPRLSDFATRLRLLDASPILERTELHYDFRYGLPVVNDFPFHAWSRIVARRATIGSVSVLGYGDAAGYMPLRVEIAEYLRRARGITCSPQQVIVTNGSQQALDLAARILIDPGDRVALEEPGYEGARQAFTAAGARVVAVPVDKEGLQVARLPGRSARCRAVYVTPSHQFPTGAVLSAPRRKQLLEWARANESYVLEDDYDGELRYDVRNIEAIKGADSDERVIYIGTMSKVLFPSLRLGYLVCPPTLVESFVTAKHVCDRQTPALLQMALSDFMTQGLFSRHLLRAKRLCAQRRRALLDAVERHLGARVTVEGANAGIHVMMWINDRPGSDVPSLISAAASIGVGIYPIAPYFMHAPQRAGLLLGYASMDEPMIAECIERLARILGEGPA
jgi:GntR family transcriptional regulator / MocR family aminotransferase